jgi:AbrB family looped-hinge helix DNA binding protein
MQHSAVTSKGQPTIPEKIRKALRIKPGDKCVTLLEKCFLERDSGVYYRTVRRIFFLALRLE